jgi:hypothetical protein
MQYSKAVDFFFYSRDTVEDTIVELHQHLRGVSMCFVEEVRYFRMNRHVLQELLTQYDLLPYRARSLVGVALTELTFYSAQFPLVDMARMLSHRQMNS